MASKFTFGFDFCRYSFTLFCLHFHKLNLPKLIVHKVHMTSASFAGYPSRQEAWIPCKDKSLIILVCASILFLKAFLAFLVRACFNSVRYLGSDLQILVIFSWLDKGTDADGLCFIDHGRGLIDLMLNILINIVSTLIQVRGRQNR